MTLRPVGAAGWVILHPLLLGAAAGPQEASESRIKAAFLYNFCIYAEWPKKSFDEDSSPIVVGVLGKDPFGDALDATLKDKKVNGRPFKIRRANRLEDLKSVHLLFVSPAEAENQKRILEAVRGSPVLVVGDTEGFVRRGGTIGFYVDENRVHFEINPDAASEAGIKLSSKLLNLARIVKPGDSP